MKEFNIEQYDYSFFADSSIDNNKIMKSEDDLRMDLKYYLFSLMNDGYMNMEEYIVEKAKNRPEELEYYLLWDDKYDFNKHPIEQFSIDTIKKLWQKQCANLYGKQTADFLLSVFESDVIKYENRMQKKISGI